MKISQMLKEKRKEYQLTQEQLAEKIFVSNKTISNWETGKTKPDIESLILLAKFFHLSLDNLLLEGSEMVESLDKDIKKGRNLKKIVLVWTLPLLITITGLFWVNYRGENQTIVPLEDISSIEITDNFLSMDTVLNAEVKLGRFESVKFVASQLAGGILYLEIWKEPKIINRKSTISVTMGEVLGQYAPFSQTEKIAVTYWDAAERKGYSMNELMDEFPKEIIWERSFQ